MDQILNFLEEAVEARRSSVVTEHCVKQKMAMVVRWQLLKHGQWACHAEFHMVLKFSLSSSEPHLPHDLKVNNVKKSRNVSAPLTEKKLANREDTAKEIHSEETNGCSYIL